MNLRDCFNEFGNLKIDPYRKLSEGESNLVMDYKTYMDIYNSVFDEDGYLLDRYAIMQLSKKMNARRNSDVVGLYHADILARATKGHYPTIYYFR